MHTPPSPPQSRGVRASTYRAIRAGSGVTGPGAVTCFRSREGSREGHKQTVVIFDPQWQASRNATPEDYMAGTRGRHCHLPATLQRVRGVKPVGLQLLLTSWTRRPRENGPNLGSRCKDARGTPSVVGCGYAPSLCLRPALGTLPPSPGSEMSSEGDERADRLSGAQTASATHHKEPLCTTPQHAGTLSAFRIDGRRWWCPPRDGPIVRCPFCACFCSGPRREPLLVELPRRASVGVAMFRGGGGVPMESECPQERDVGVG